LYNVPVRKRLHTAILLILFLLFAWQVVALGYPVEHGMCLTPGMTPAQRAAQRQLSVADYTVLFEVTTIDAATYCTLSDEAIAAMMRDAYAMHDAERRSGAGGLWLRIEHWFGRVAARLGGF
jgi:hypothetical protein